MTRSRAVATGIAAAALLILQGCYTAPAPSAPPPRPMSERFEQSWQAVKGAAYDANVRVTQEDRGSGTLRGEQGASKVVVTVVPQADQTIQVGISVTGGDSYQDDTLKRNLTQAYQRRMGR
jgi:hypothetical protein